MRFRNTALMSLVLIMILGGTIPSRAEEKPAEKPDHWVSVMYFHRTKRCPTCKKISAYIEESAKKGFAEQMKAGEVGCYMIDYQDAKNSKYSRFYKISGPTLVIADVRQGKVTEWKPMPQVWSLVFKKEAFFKYVQDGIGGYLEKK